jgi:hypothetical protein
VTAWQDVEQAEPQFAWRVRALFGAHRHKTIATLRADGSPRISGIETVFEDGELVWLDAGVSVATTAKAYRLLKAIMNTAVDDGLIRRNSCRIKCRTRQVNGRHLIALRTASRCPAAPSQERAVGL